MAKVAEIKEVEVAVLKPYENNAKIHGKDQVEKICNSIKEFGFLSPCLIDRDLNIIAGHGRVLAAQKLGLKTVPCLFIEGLTDEQRKAYILADNRLTELGEWNMDIVIAELKDLDFSGFDVSVTGFDLDLDGEEETEIQEDEIPDVPKEPTAKPGDIWILGRHRVICGDSTDVTVIDRLMDGKKANLVFTDPPYGMKKENEGVLNDNLNYDDLLEFNRQWIPLTFGALKENGSWYCWGTDEPLMDIYSNILKPMQKENKITFRNLITWDKKNGQGQMSEDFRMYAIADEKCLFVMSGVQGFSTNADNYFEAWEPIRAYLAGEAEKVGLTPKTIKEIFGFHERMWSHWFGKSQFIFIPEEHYKTLQEYYKGDAFKREYDDIKREYYSTRAFFDNTHDNMNNVWHFDRASVEEREQTGGHATPKPIALCSRAIKSSSREGEIVLDVFGGSGSTLIACEQLNRTCYMSELDPGYVDVIVKRWENLTGKKAVLMN